MRRRWFRPLLRCRGPRFGLAPRRSGSSEGRRRTPPTPAASCRGLPRSRRRCRRGGRGRQHPQWWRHPRLVPRQRLLLRSEGRRRRPARSRRRCRPPTRRLRRGARRGHGRGFPIAPRIRTARRRVPGASAAADRRAGAGRRRGRRWCCRRCLRSRGPHCSRRSARRSGRSAWSPAPWSARGERADRCAAASPPHTRAARDPQHPPCSTSPARRRRCARSRRAARARARRCDVRSVPRASTAARGARYRRGSRCRRAAAAPRRRARRHRR